MMLIPNFVILCKVIFVVNYTIIVGLVNFTSSAPRQTRRSITIIVLRKQYFNPEKWSGVLGVEQFGF